MDGVEGWMSKSDLSRRQRTQQWAMESNDETTEEADATFSTQSDDGVSMDSNESGGGGGGGNDGRHGGRSLIGRAAAAGGSGGSTLVGRDEGGGNDTIHAAAADNQNTRAYASSASVVGGGASSASGYHSGGGGGGAGNHVRNLWRNGGREALHHRSSPRRRQSTGGANAQPKPAAPAANEASGMSKWRYPRQPSFVVDLNNEPDWRSEDEKRAAKPPEADDGVSSADVVGRKNALDHLPASDASTAYFPKEREEKTCGCNTKWLVGIAVAAVVVLMLILYVATIVQVTDTRAAIQALLNDNEEEEAKKNASLAGYSPC